MSLVRISNREQLIRALNALVDRIAESHEPIENDRTEIFLEALTRYVEDIDGWYKNQGLDIAAVSPWQVFYDSIEGALIYE